jgi:N6-L-threonylcarbamoyladenine synthase
MTALLGIESTCDETGASVVIDGFEVRSNVVASQVDLHRRYRGVVPEIASRAHIESILPTIRRALDDAGRSLQEIDAVVIANRPGLIGSLLIGVTAAKTIAWAIGKPLVAVDHVQAHLYSVMLEQNRAPAFPAIGLVVSGGHTALYFVSAWNDVKLIGSTIDDAVGEAYDKVAAILGLGYPGGPIVDELAARGDPRAIRFPRPMLGRTSLDFSFSGLKTAVLYHVRGVPGKEAPPHELTESSICDIAASFQAACVETIRQKLLRALRLTGARSVIVGGGVSANKGLRHSLQALHVPVVFPKLSYCTDNAAMSAGLGYVAFREGRFASLDLDAVTSSGITR